jgi:demethoxyubiquinone hydroxylase (CLK1/Coq7/Cat5 family)
MSEPEKQLIRILRAAHAGEHAAALAYYGHARSVKKPEEKQAIQRIGEEEIAHRRRVGEMLASLHAKPAGWREVIFAGIGHTLSMLCAFTGWFCPMYGAGWIERRNIQEYIDAAQNALAAGHVSFAQELARMAQVEWDHEQYFRSCVERHWLSRWIPLWSMPAKRNDLVPELTNPITTAVEPPLPLTDHCSVI